MIVSYVEKTIGRPIPDNRGVRCYTKRPDYMDQKEVDGCAHVVFIAYYADPHVLKKAMALKKNARVYLTFIAGCIREEVNIDQYFDQYYEYMDFRELYDIVRESAPYSWHAVTPMYHAAIVLTTRCGEENVVVDVVDAVFFIGRSTEIDLEREILSQADCVVHKMPGKAWQILAENYGLKCDEKAIMGYIQPAVISRPAKKKQPALPHVVYAGGVIPYKIAKERGHENHIFDDLIALTGPDTFELSIFVNQNARDMPWHQHEHYYELEKAFPYFHFRKGLPYDEAVKALSNFDAGIFYDNLSLASYNPDHFRYNLASKFFSYLEAGLPIVIYRESELMAKIVEEYNFGAVYDALEPITIIPAIQSACCMKEKSRIDDFSRLYCLKKTAYDLIQAHKLQPYEI